MDEQPTIEQPTIEQPTIEQVEPDERVEPELVGMLRRHLQQGRDGIVAALAGLSEYDVRRPMTASGTNLLGLVKHLAGVEFGYLGECVGRPRVPALAWDEDGSMWEGGDMWATAQETRQQLVALYRAAWAHSDAAISELGLGAPAHVAWWPPERRDTTLGLVLVRTVAETAQHAGHADILRELIDGRGGRDHDEFGDAEHWAQYVQRLQEVADRYR
jgi:hypothetical protein